MNLQALSHEFLCGSILGDYEVQILSSQWPLDVGIIAVIDQIAFKVLLESESGLSPNLYSDFHEELAKLIVPEKPLDHYNSSPCQLIKPAGDRHATERLQLVDSGCATSQFLTGINFSYVIPKAVIDKYRLSVSDLVKQQRFLILHPSHWLIVNLGADEISESTNVFDDAEAPLCLNFGGLCELVPFGQGFSVTTQH